MIGIRVILLFVAIAGLIAVYGLTWVSKRIEHVASGVRSLPSRTFEQMTLVALGSSGNHSNHLRRGPSVGIGKGTELILVDTGSGMSESLRASEIPVNQPNTVLFSSLMPENTVGFDDLVVARSFDSNSAPLTVLGPPGTDNLVNGLWKTHISGLQARQTATRPSVAHLKPRVTEVSSFRTFQIGSMEITAVPLNGGPLAGLAFLVEDAGKRALISSSGWDPETLVRLGEGIDVWFHEAIYRDSLEAAIEAGAPEAEALREEATRHTALEDIGTLASRMQVRILVLTRLRPPPVFDFQYTRIVEQEFSGHVIIADDGDTFTP